MRITVICIALMLSVFSGYTQLSDSQSIQTTHRSFIIVAFGTSLTLSAQVAQEDKWTSLLQTMLQQRHPDMNITVINAGIGGSSTRSRLPHLQKDVLDKNPDLVIHDFAANDANPDPERHVYLDEFARNIKTMHEQIMAKTRAEEIYWPQPPILSEKHSWRQEPLFVEAGGLDKYSERYRKCTAKMSRELGVTFVNMDMIFRKKFKEKSADFYILSDGIHFQRSANQLVAESLLSVVEKIMQKK